MLRVRSKSSQSSVLALAEAFLKTEKPYKECHVNGKYILRLLKPLHKGAFALCWPGVPTSSCGLSYNGFTFEFTPECRSFASLSRGPENLEPVKAPILQPQLDGSVTFTTGVFFRTTTALQAGDVIYYDFAAQGPNRASLHSSFLVNIAPIS